MAGQWLKKVWTNVACWRAAALGVVMVLSAPALGQQGGVGAGPFAGHVVVRAVVKDQRELMAVTAIAENIWSCRFGVGPIEVQLTPAQREAMDDLGIAYEVMIPDVQALVDAEAAQIRDARRQRTGDFFITYRTRTEIYDRLTQLAQANPTLASVETIGQSLEGRPLIAVRITGPDSAANPRASRPQVVFNGTQHAREWVSPMTVTYIAVTLAESYATDQRVRDLLDRVEFIIVPIVNPDGYEWTWASTNNRLWRKNRRNNGDGTFGVDLNRNWSFQWGGPGSSGATNSDIYRGPSAFSEPETQVMRDFLQSLPRMRAHIDFHSFSQLILSPWGYTAELPVDATVFDSVNARIRQAILSAPGLPYTAGPSNTTIYPASGVAPDWVFGALGVPSWTIELRDTGQFGFVLPADQIIPTATENFAAVLVLGEEVLRPVWFGLPLGEVTQIDTVATTPFQIDVRGNLSQVANAPLRLATRLGTSGDYTFTDMTLFGPGVWASALPAAPCGSVLEYYVEVPLVGGGTARYPQTSATAVITARPSASIVRLSDDFESDQGWTVGAAGDNATAGVWERAVPQATAAQPGTQTTPGGSRCFITGAAAGSGVGANDVDGGVTTLTSPRFSLVPPSGQRSRGIFVSYARWYSNNAGSNPNNDSMPVLISNDDGATWTQIELVTENAGAWRRVSPIVPASVAPTDAMRLRFVARDLGGGSIVEAAVDDVLAGLRACPVTADFNDDGEVDPLDIRDFLAAYRAGDPLADFDGSGEVEPVDVRDFFAAYRR
jgi:murein tripeptide amidase MpaA